MKLNDKGGAPRVERREDLPPLRTEAERPRGIGGLPASTGREPRKITFEDIAKMSDEEYARLPGHIKEAYLAGGRLD